MGDVSHDAAGDDPGSGYFTDSSRKAALAASLPYVATYFVRSDRLPLRDTNLLGTSRRQDPGRLSTPRDPVIASLRLRAALASGTRLVEIISDLLRAGANFRFEQVRDEHVGHLHGRLDVVRYIQQRGRRTAPRRYPIVDLRQSAATPENIMAASALHWHIKELDTCLTALGPIPEGPETKRAAEIRAGLTRFASHPTFRGASEGAELIARRETIGELLDTVDARLRAGHVSRSYAYERLADWVRQAISGEADLEHGDLLASFYGQAFDNKLFELWSLTQLAQAMSDILGPPASTVPHLLRSESDEPIFQWDAGADSIELYFQPSLSRLLGVANRWRYRESNQELRGYPDLAARCVHVDGTAEVVLLDAKLRRRRNAAWGQELYKLLGYFSNAGRPIQLGALIFHSPQGFRSGDAIRRWVLEQDEDVGSGAIEIVAVDPADDPSATSSAFAHLARLVVSGTGIARDQVQCVTSVGFRDPDASPEDLAGSRAQALAVAQLEAAASRLPSELLETTARNLFALLESTWLGLDTDTRRMITTAVHFGVTAPEGADLAGPVLGLCASLERLLRDRLAVPALINVADTPGCDAGRWTLGTLITRLRESTLGRENRAARELKTFLDNRGIKSTLLGALLDDLDQLRAQHRNVAAHRGLVERAQWSEVYRTVLKADAALLPRLHAIVNGTGD
ncbi:hypothetical protein [Blastococcus sp. SYSU DS0973]